MPWHDGPIGWSILLGMYNLLSQEQGHLECRRCHWSRCLGGPLLNESGASSHQGVDSMVQAEPCAVLSLSLLPIEESGLKPYPELICKVRTTMCQALRIQK